MHAADRPPEPPVTVTALLPPLATIPLVFTSGAELAEALAHVSDAAAPTL